MFKKKGPSGFKPKIPSARPRPTTRPAAPTPAASTQTTVAASNIRTEPVDEQTQTSVASVPEQDQEPEPVAESSSAAPPVLPTPPSTSRSADQRKTTRSQGNKQPAGDVSLEGAPTEEQPAEATIITPRRHRGAPRKPPTPSATPVIPAIEEVRDSIPTEAPAPAPAAIEATAETLEEAPAPSAPVSKPTKRTKRAAATTESATDEANEGESAKPKKRQPRATQDGEAAPKPKRARKAPSGEPRATRARRARSLTPEDAETQTVDLQTLKMADLTKDLHIGKKFSRHDELRERERQKKLKAKFAKLGKEDDGISTPNGEGTETPEDSAESAQLKSNSETPAPSVPPESSQQAPAGPQFRIVDGQIVVDQESLAVDRHARAAAARAGQDMETIEENDFTRLITSNSFMNTSKLKGPNIWSDEETAMFYRGIAMFGTDFEIISKMIPGKTRRHVKLKFNREERHCPRRVNAALIGEKTVAMDIDEYKAVTGSEFETVEKINAEQQKIEDDYEAERKRIADEQAEAMRKKREELFADEDVGGVVQKKKKKGKKKKVEYGLNGEPIETEDY